MEFEQRKAATMAAIASTDTDKSPKGTIDTPIIPLLTTINNHPSFYTTSSCSGRISIFSHLPNKPKGGTWLFISHEPTHPNSVLDILFTTSPESTHSDSDHHLVFRFEPLIIAVECKDVASAQFLVSLAISSGFRESGITSVSSKRVIIAIRCSIRLEVPLGCRRQIMVSREYVKYLVDIANQKMDANWRRTQGFMEALRKNGFIGSQLGNGSVGFSDHVNEKAMTREQDDCGDVNPEMTNFTTDSGPLESTGSSLSIVPIQVIGEPLERLFIWGHSSCVISYVGRKEILIYGGFGGIGRHARRNDCLLFDPLSGRVAEFAVDASPSPRLGHTSSLVGDLMVVIGGRADPTNILGDLWIFDVTKTEWKLVRSADTVFAPRHRHAAAVVGSKIYVFGGLYNDMLYSSLHVLNVDTLQWEEIQAFGDLPCARHSHSLVTHGPKLYLFGGYNGEKALGDLYSFDVQECRWSKVKTSGKAPYPRFSHSMFSYKDYLGIIGGCPVRQHCQILSLLDLSNLAWKHVVLDSVGKDLFVRSTANIVDDELIMIGGGAACYAFGTKFSEPAKINLFPVATLRDAFESSLVDKKQTVHQHEATDQKVSVDRSIELSEVDSDLNLNRGANGEDNGHAAANATYWVLKLQRKYGKLAKDLLKKFGWLDLSRKAYSHEDGSCIYFPVIGKFYALFSGELSQKRGTFGELSDLNISKAPIDSDSTALDLLVTCGATMHIDEFVALKKAPISPLEAMKIAVAALLKDRGLSEDLLEELPTRWDRLGDIFVLPISSFNNPEWDTIGEELWSAVAKSLGARRLARQGRVAPTGTRDSRLEILVGDNGWVEHRENGILYSFDATKCMFSWGNLSEKLRMARLDCRDEVIVDLFAGIGYFTLPFLVRAQAKLVYACEWNPYAVEALQHNIQANSVSDRCVVIEGDNRLTAPKGIANRVCLGLLPSSEGSWATAVEALRDEGGTLHIHENVKDSDESRWTEYVVKSISEIAKSQGRCWEVSMIHLERVKWYAPHIRHVVADVTCKNIQI